MWAQTLKQLNHQLIPAQAAARWKADPNSLQLISDGINIVYRFTINGLGKYLRLTHPNLRSRQELLSAIHYQNYLFQLGAPVCESLKSHADSYIEEIQQNNTLFLAQCLSEVPGHIMHFEHTDITIYISWGRALADLHRAAKTYRAVHQGEYKTWRDVWQELIEYLATEEKAIINEYQVVSHWFASLSENDNDFGLTHGDHRPGNVLTDGERVSIIDFDEPIYHWFNADIARAFLEIYNQETKQWQKKFKAFIQGYRMILTLDDVRINQLTWFIRMKNLELYLWTKYNWHEAQAPGGGSTEQWLQELKQCILSAELKSNFLD